ncbi:hypothetical protein HG530_000979 [Fusarium avenaceum]|nr:hypothetical protein HG530_000979 [Fusarium avenaceum]
MAQAIPLEESDVYAIRKSLDTSHQVSSWSPTQSAFKTIDWLTCAVEFALARVNSNYSARTLLYRVDSNISAISSPADRRRTVLVDTGQSFVDLFWDSGITHSLCTSTLELSLLLSPAN